MTLALLFQLYKKTQIYLYKEKKGETVLWLTLRHTDQLSYIPHPWCHKAVLETQVAWGKKNTENVAKDTLTCQRMCVAASQWISDSRSVRWDLKAQGYEENIKNFNQHCTSLPTAGMACVLISILILLWLQWTHQHNCWDWRTQRCPYNGVIVFGTRNSPELWQDVMQYSQIKSTSSCMFFIYVFFIFLETNPKLQLTTAQKISLHLWYASMDGCLQQNMLQLFIFVLIHRGVSFFHWALNETDYKNIIHTSILVWILLAYFNLVFFTFLVKVPTLKATWWN